MAKTTINTLITESRYQDLKAMLEERRLELVCEVHAKIRDARAENTHDHNVLDEGDISDVDIQADIGFALIQMKSEMLDRIDTALRRISEGSYGICLECGDEIAEPRLTALPFAVRCKECEESREVAERRERMTARRNPSSLYPDVSTIA
jgi:DnaK suppressor protein